MTPYIKIYQILKLKSNDNTKQTPYTKFDASRVKTSELGGIRLLQFQRVFKSPGKIGLKLGLGYNWHGAIYRPDSFVLVLRYCANLKAIRYESTSLNRIVADKSHRVIVALHDAVCLTPCFVLKLGHCVNCEVMRYGWLQRAITLFPVDIFQKFFLFLNRDQLKFQIWFFWVS